MNPPRPPPMHYFCPRCGREFAPWQTVHWPCALARLRVFLLALLAFTLGVAAWVGWLNPPEELIERAVSKVREWQPKASAVGNATRGHPDTMRQGRFPKASHQGRAG